MGVKLEELLKLPSLKEAKVVSGATNLSNTVTSLSFLEVSDMSFFNEKIGLPDEYYAGELVIGSFFTIKDDVEKQCEAIRRLHGLGELGIILYYVGIVLDDLAQEVIDVAEELGFVIIKMPENDYSLRYNEVIVEVMTELLKQKSTENIVNEVLEKTSSLPEHLRNVEMSLKSLSDLLRANIILTDEEGEIINQIRWPRNSKLKLANFLLSADRNANAPIKKENCWVFSREIFHKDNGVLNVYLVKEHEPLTPSECEQSVELIQVALNLWGKKHGEVSEHGLVKAILNDESEKMYRLANKLSIDVKSINLMWLFQLKGPEKEKEIKAEVLDYVTKYYHTSIVQLVEDQLIVLLGNYRYNEQEVALSENFLGSSQFVMEIESLAVCPRLRNTTDVRKNYQLINSLKEELSTLFIGKKHFTISEVRQVQQAIECVRSGEVKVDEVLRNIQPIIENTEQMHTLCTFLLDADADYQKCGEYLFIHKNTVKYRIKRINELLGCDVTRISDSYEYSITCLVYRIVRRSNLL